jgi:hypothetical protein
MLLQYPSANSTENSPKKGKNEYGSELFLNTHPTSAGSSLEITLGNIEYFLYIAYPVRGDILFGIVKVFMLRSVYFFSNHGRRKKWIFFL